MSSLFEIRVCVVRTGGSRVSAEGSVFTFMARKPVSAAPDF